ncbi:unnamed protein product [Urochloa decumbens]|uniref:Uncharacterized protein n=1 Tax=Urochloa decumbens TaxID=240449 RepID=A0ABC8YT24_9POAL
MAFPYYMTVLSTRPLWDPGYVQLGANYPRPRASQATRNFCRVFLRCFAATVGIVMLACLFVLRYAYHDPEMEDNFVMIFCSVVVLIMVGFIFLMTHEDGDLET